MCLIFRTVHFTCTYKPGVLHFAADSAGSEPSNPSSSMITCGTDFWFWVLQTNFLSSSWDGLNNNEILWWQAETYS